MKKIEIELPEIEGFEYTGEYRRPRKGEWFISSDDNSFAICASYNWDDFRLILKKKAPKYRLAGDPTNLAGPKFVELKALKDAMSLVNMIILDLDADETATYHSLMDLIK